MSIELDRYRLIVLDLASVLQRDNGRFHLMPSAQQWLAQQPMRAPDQTPFIAVVEYLPIAVGTRYTPLASGLTRRLPIDGAKSLLGRWPDPAVLRLCQRLYGSGPSLLLGNSQLHFVAAQAVGFDFYYVQAMFRASKQVQAGDVTARWCPRCGPQSPLVVGGQNEDKLICASCGYRTDAPESIRLLNSGAARLL